MRALTSNFVYLTGNLLLTIPLMIISIWPLSLEILNFPIIRYPVCSNLNLDTWHRYLHDYHDKRLIQYLTFGFPLSIQDDSNLHNTDITNHHSAIQFPEAVNKYLDKEIQMGPYWALFRRFSMSTSIVPLFSLAPRC